MEFGGTSVRSAKSGNVKNFGRTTPREPASKARIRRRSVVALAQMPLYRVGEDTFTARHHSGRNQPCQSSPSGTTTLVQQTRVSHGLRLYRGWLDRARRLNSPPVSSMAAGHRRSRSAAVLTQAAARRQRDRGRRSTTQTPRCGLTSL